MKNNRLNGFIIFAVAIVVVGGLTYYEFTRLPPKQTMLGNPPETDEPISLGNQSTVPSTAPAASATTAEAPSAPAASAATAETPSAPAASGTATAAAPATPPPSSTATAAAPATPPPSSTATAETPATPPPAASGTATAETSSAPAASGTAIAAAPATPPPSGTATAETSATPLASGTETAETSATSPSSGTETAEAVANPPAPATPAAPAAPAAETAAAKTPAAAAPAPSAGQQVATAEPPPSAAQPKAPAAPAAKPVVPSFDVVRVEPSGETVVAGTATPGAKVDILDGPATVATATANDRGEWAMALDNALKPGTHDLAIRTISKDGGIATLSDERVAVDVPKPGSKDVLVVLNSPDRPSRVLELPKAKQPAATGGEQVASAAPTTGNGSARQPEAPKTGGDVAALQPKSPAAQSPDLVSPPPQSGRSGSAPSASATPAPPAGANAPAETPAAPVVAQEPPAKPAKPAAPKPEVSVSAVEADTAGTLYVAGTAKTGQTVRVYLDNKPLGEAKPSPSGTWLVEVHHEVPPGDYTVRADQVSGPDGTVIARAEVPFDRKIDVASLKASGNTGAAATADVSGTLPQVKTVIIKRGDNLWTIARDTWGRGITWSTLYQANKDQIRNPHWIYPGQVFIMPASPKVSKN